jgi:hypothetical protein
MMSCCSTSLIADGINHCVPTQTEMRESLSWLLNDGQIQMRGSKYTLTKKGMINYNFASRQTNLILHIWKNLDRQLKIV